MIGPKHFESILEFRKQIFLYRMNNISVIAGDGA
jgi:hypothetical protein